MRRERRAAVVDVEVPPWVLSSGSIAAAARRATVDGRCDITAACTERQRTQEAAAEWCAEHGLAYSMVGCGRLQPSPEERAAGLVRGAGSVYARAVTAALQRGERP